MNHAWLCLLCVLATAFTPLVAETQILSPRSIYERCYSKLVRETPQANDPYLIQINNGTLTGAQACKNLLRLARFTVDGRIPPYTTTPELNALAKRVLHSMNDLHASWINNRSFTTANACAQAVTASVVDPLEPAYYFTRALFQAETNFATVVTSTDNLRAVRSEDNPVVSIFDPRYNGKVPELPATFKHAGHGELLGIEIGQDPVATRMTARTRAPAGEASTPAVTNYRILQNSGGGVIGSQAYLLNNYGDAGALFPDLEMLPRTWSQYVFKDLLCRELPVITEADAEPFRVCESTGTCGIKVTADVLKRTLSFRTSTSCVQCHASMDQLAGVVRNFRQFNTGPCRFNDPIAFGSHHMVKEVPTLPLDKVWGYLADSNYRKKPGFGRFLFRTHNNTKIDAEVSSLAQLGTVISNTDDLYICAAKRYYRYFTGIDVDIKPMTAIQVNSLPADQKFYRNRVVSLGIRLKDPAQFNKDPMRLIEAIFDLPEFRNRDFNLATNAQGTQP